MQSMEQQVQDKLLLQSLIPADLQRLLTKAYDDPVLFTNKLLGLPLHRGQVKWLRKATKKINILTPSNRWGKTTVTAPKHIWKNFYKHGVGRGNANGWRGVKYRTANLSPHSAQTEACFNFVKQIMTSTYPIPQIDGSVVNNECLIGWFYDEKRTQNSAPYRVFFTNNSEIEFRQTGADKGDSIQGRPFGYISYDEGGRSDHLKREVEDNILPRLTDWRGTLDIPSTPDQNSPSILEHFEMYQKGLDPDDPIYYTQEGSLEENDFLSEEAKREQYQIYDGTAIGPQVLHGKFVFAGAMVFGAEEIINSKTESLDVTKEEEFIPGHSYLISIDTSIGSDERVYTVLDDTNLRYDLITKKWSGKLRQVAKRHCVGNTMSPQLHQFELLDLYDKYKDPNARNVKIALETFNGESARFYMDMPRELQRVTVCYGSWQPPTPEGVPKKKRTAARLVKKADIVVALKKALAAGILERPHNDDIADKQLQIYKEDDNKIPNDHTISLALGVYFCTDGKPRNKATGETVAIEI